MASLANPELPGQLGSNLKRKIPGLESIFLNSFIQASGAQPVRSSVSNNASHVDRQPSEEAGQPQVRHQLRRRRGAADGNGASG